MHSFFISYFFFLMTTPTTATTESTATNTEQVTTEPSQTETTNTESEEKATPQELKQREMVASKQKQIDEGIVSHNELAPWLQELTTPKATVKNEVDEKQSLVEQAKKEALAEIAYDEALKTVPSDTSKEKLEMMEEIMGNAAYSNMDKVERLEFAKFKVGITTSHTIEAARKEGIEIGKFGLLGIGNHEGEKPETELSKTEAKYDTVPAFLKQATK